MNDQDYLEILDTKYNLDCSEITDTDNVSVDDLKNKVVILKLVQTDTSSITKGSWKPFEFIYIFIYNWVKDITDFRSYCKSNNMKLLIVNTHQFHDDYVDSSFEYWLTQMPEYVTVLDPKNMADDIFGHYLKLYS